MTKGKYQSIFIANITEYARPLLSLVKDLRQKQAEIEEDFGLCDRFLIADRDDRVLISPWPINKEFLKDTCKIFNFKNILNLNPSKPTISLCEDILREKKLKDFLIKIIKENRPEIYSYVGSDEFLKLINFFKKQGLKFKTPEAPKKSGLVKFFGSKAGFREIFNIKILNRDLNNLCHAEFISASKKIPKPFPSQGKQVRNDNSRIAPLGIDRNLLMPEGHIAIGKQEILHWAKYFYKKKKSFVIKTNYGLAGAGSEIVDIKKIKKGIFNSWMEKIINKHPYWLKEKTVVEEFINADFKVCGGSPSVEFAVPTDVGIKYLYSCGMRIVSGGVFRGIEIGEEAVPKWIEDKMKSYGFKFAKVLQKAGYRGYFDTDFVNTANGELYTLEANIRRTGGTHVYEAGLWLLGKNFLRNYYLVSNNLYEDKKLKRLTYGKLKTKLQSLLYPLKGKKKGLILTTVSLLPQGKLGYIVVGKNKKEVMTWEEEMTELLFKS